MSELIPLTQHEGVQAVTGRDLHKFLEVTTRYNDWITRLIKKYGFAPGADYVLKNEYVPGANNRRYEKTDHVLTLDMAKELSMVQNNDKGRQARQYFIECERRARQPMAELSKMDVLKMALESEQARLALEEKTRAQSEALAAAAPKVDYHDTFIAEDGDLITIRDLAGKLQVQETWLRSQLVAHKWIYSKGYERFSNQRGRKVTEYLWFACAGKKQYFDPVFHHDKPRLGGQVRRTLKVKPSGALAISRAVARWMDGGAAPAVTPPLTGADLNGQNLSIDEISNLPTL